MGDKSRIPEVFEAGLYSVTVASDALGEASTSVALSAGLPGVAEIGLRK